MNNNCKYNNVPAVCNEAYNLQETTWKLFKHTDHGNQIRRHNCKWVKKHLIIYGGTFGDQ